MMQLKQLEEKERLPESYFATELRGRSNQLPSASDMDGVHIKEAIMNRLNLLENRILQLSHELDKGGSSSDGGGSGGGQNTMALAYPSEKQKHILRDSMYQSQTSIKKAMEPIQAATTEAIDKRSVARCRNEKKRMDRSRLHKRWFHVGC